MTATAPDPMSWFPYIPRPHQDKAVAFAANVFARNTVGLLSADCGVGKTIAVLSGYLAARSHDPDFRLVILTRTHSQSDVFEEELETLRNQPGMPFHIPLTATSMVSRVHICPYRESMKSKSSGGFMRECAKLVSDNKCTYYWNVYKIGNDNKYVIRGSARRFVEDLVYDHVVTREKAEDAMYSEDYCPYEVLRWASKKSRVVIGPYAYLFQYRVRTALLSSLGVSLNKVDVLVDEAHNLGDHILDSESAVLTGADISKLREEKITLAKTTGIEWIPEMIDFLWRTFKLNLDKIQAGGERELETWEVIPRFVDETTLEALVRSYETNGDDIGEDVHIETEAERMANFCLAGVRAVNSDLETGEGKSWHATIEAKRVWKSEMSITDTRIRIRPLNAAGLTARILRGTKSAILMSGTLNPLSHYASLLGVATAMRESVASPYPRGSRLVLLDRTLTTKYTERSPELMGAIGERISTALTVMPANKSALVAFPSYSLMENVLSYGINTGYRERIVEKPKDKVEVLKEAVESKPHAVFAVYGGKFSEGIDLVKGGSSLVDMIIGVGVPYGPPSSYNRALQKWYESKFGGKSGYYYSSVIPAVRKVAQLAGRLRRAPDDWGIILLLDRRFQRHIGVFGDAFVSDLWPYDTSEEMMSAITQFLERRRGELG